MRQLFCKLVLYNSMMEEYENKQQYLRHLKKIGEIRGGGARKQPLFPHSSSLNHSKLLTSSSRRATQWATESRHHHTSTERIMRDFIVEKENMRLASKILRMNSSIPLRKYQQDYDDAKRFIARPSKERVMTLKFFDIRFTVAAPLPEDCFAVYLQLSGKRVLLAKEPLFELRKRELKVKKEAVVRVEWENEWGVARLTEGEGLIDLQRKGQKVGHLVIDHK